jgi:hypothetical protein
MAEISKITLPSGNTYDIKDAVARQAIAGGVSFNIAWDGQSVPVVANIPEGVVVTYNETDYTGTLAASSSTIGIFYLIWVSSDTQDHYSEYATIQSGSTYTWEKIGDVKADLTGLVTSVALNKGTGDNVLGEDTTFTAASSSVSFSGGTDDKVLGADTTFSVTQPTISVTPSTTNVKATASGTAVGPDGTDRFITSYPGETRKLATTTVPNVTSAGSASTWGFAMGTGNDSETLIISGANGSAPTLGTSITCATGSLAANGSGDYVMTGLGTPTTADALTGIKVTSQPTVLLSVGATAGTGVISVATGITSASASGAAVTANSNDEVTAITGIGTGTAAAQTITVGTNDKVTVAKHVDLSLTVSTHS